MPPGETGCLVCSAGAYKANQTETWQQVQSTKGVLSMETASLAYDLTLALTAALIGGALMQRLNLPALVGYMLAGIAVSPFALNSAAADLGNIQLLAEIGVVLLMFGVGVDFSLQQLKNVQKIALFGGGAQILLTISLGVGLGLLLGWPWGWQLFFGCALALSSTTVLLKILMDRGELGSKHGQITLGISLVQDLSTILMMALLPALTVSTSNGNPLLEIGWSVLRTIVFLALMLLFGTRFFPWILTRIALRGSRELFLLSTVVLSLGTAFLATSLFGLSLALGAFVAGLVVSESELHYRILGELLPIRDIFAVLFFVSVGMLIDPLFVWQNWSIVLLVSAVIVVGKFAVTLLALWFFPYSRRTILLSAAGLAQIGEFSFILAALGMNLGVLDDYMYGLILSGALISTVATPFMIRLAGPLADVLDQLVPSRQLRPAAPLPEVPHGLRGHVVVCGYGRVGQHVVEALRELDQLYVVIEQDWVLAHQLREEGSLTIYGDASQPSVLSGAHLERARVAVVTVHDPALQRLIVQEMRSICPHIPIVARAERASDLPYLYQDGATDVIVPIFEGGMEILRQSLLRLGVTAEAIQSYIDTIHNQRYEPWRNEHLPPDDTLMATLRRVSQGLTIQWYQLRPDSAYEGRTIGSLNIRQQTGASLVAVVRNNEVLVNPAADTMLKGGDRLAILGTDEQRQQFVTWLSYGELGFTVPPQFPDGDGVELEQPVLEAGAKLA